MRSIKMIIGIIIAAGLFVIVGAGVWFTFFIPEAGQQQPVGSGSVLVNISYPLNNTTVAVSDPVTISALAVSEQSITDLQVSVNGIDLPMKFIPDQVETGRYQSTWSWTPTEEGGFVLLARAYTAQGMAEISNAVKVKVVAQPSSEGLSGPPPALAQTQVAAVKNTIKDSPTIPAPPPFPTIVSNSPIFPDQTEFADEIKEPAPAVSFPAKYSLFLQGVSAWLKPVNLAAAPDLKGGPNKCNASLVIGDQTEIEAGFFLYRLGPGESTFKRVATLDPHPGTGEYTFHDSNLPTGGYSYYVSAVNSAGESASNVIYLEINGATCMTKAGSQFDLKEFNVVPRQPVDKMYCYASLDGGPWTRLPAGRKVFVSPVNGKYNFGPLLSGTFPVNPQASAVIRADCWGWNGTDLEGLGQFEQTLHNTDSSGSYHAELMDNFDYQDLIPKPNPHGKVLAPINLHIGNISCTYSWIGQSEKCNETSKQIKKKGLFWEWQQYPDDCDYPYFACPYYKASGFRVYSICPNDNTFNLVADIANPEQKFLNGLTTGIYDRKDCVNQQFVVRGYNSFSGESDDSNPVDWNQGYVLHTLYPISVEASRITYVYDFTGHDFENSMAFDSKTPDSHPWVGYLNTCDLENAPFHCYEFRDNAIVKFKLPVDVVKVTDASLYWMIEQSKSWGAGSAFEAGGCSVRPVDLNPVIDLAVENYGNYKISDIPPAAIAHYISNTAESENVGDLGFEFYCPYVPLSPSYSEDSCEIKIGNIYMEYIEKTY